MKNTILILLLFVSIHNSAAQSNLSKQEAFEDIDYFIDIAEKIHVNIYAKISKEATGILVRNLKKSIGDSISKDDFSKQMRVLGNAFGDGHTNVYFSEHLYDEYEKSNSRLPFEISIESEQLQIVKSKNTDILNGDIILAINGIPSRELLQLLKYPVADQEISKYKSLGKYFSFYLFIEYGFSDKYTIDLDRAGVAMTKTIEIPKKSKKEKAKKKKIYNFDISSDSIGMLTINTFANSRIKEKSYKAFLDSTFLVIHNIHIDNLIIDLRANGGGNSHYGKILAAHLGISKYKEHQLYQVKTSKPTKKYLRKRYFKWYLYPLYPFAAISKWGRIFFFKKNGTVTNIKITTEKLKLPESVFPGNVFILTTDDTYSAAADFIVGFKNAKRGILIGDRLGQPYSGFIDKIPFTLPHSKLTGGVSFKKYEYIGTTEINHHQGIEPDIQLDENDFRTEEEFDRRVKEIIRSYPKSH